MKQKFITKALLTSSIAVVMSQASAVPTSRIINGTQATSGAYPWMVSLQGNGQHFCGASLIDKEWVLTAAHCVEQEIPSSVNVVVGEFNTGKVDIGEQKRNVTKIIIHPKRSGDDHDIALLKLSSAVSNKVVSQVTPSIMQNIKAGASLTVMGWGNQSTSGSVFPDNLFEVQVPLVSQADCKLSYGASSITENMICAGLKEGGKDSCQGDSGGPLLHQLDGTWQQVGIVSWGEGCAQPDKPGVYARVENYNEWIKQQIGSTGTVDPVDPVDPTLSINNSLESLNLPDEIELYAIAGESEETVLVLENTTTNGITISDISINDSQFTIANNDCSRTLAAGDSCELKLSFNPEEGSDEAYADLVVDLADGSNLFVSLFGTNLSLLSSNTDNDENIDWYACTEGWSADDEGYTLDGSQLDIDDSATLSAEIEGDGTFDFDFEFQNDSDDNYCEYYVDDELVKIIRGSERRTVHHVTQLSKGKHKIKWVYKKKGENSGSIKIKNVKLSNAQTTTTTTTTTATSPVSPNSGNTLTSNTGTTAPASGGGSTDILLLSGLLLLLGRSRKLFSKH